MTEWKTITIQGGDPEAARELLAKVAARAAASEELRSLSDLFDEVQDEERDDRG